MLAGQCGLAAFDQPDSIEEGGNVLAAQLRRQSAGNRRLRRANPETFLSQIALIRRSGGQPSAKHLVERRCPLGGNLQPIGQGRPLHLLAEDLVQRPLPRLQLPLQA